MTAPYARCGSEHPDDHGPLQRRCNREPHEGDNTHKTSGQDSNGNWTDTWEGDHPMWTARRTRNALNDWHNREGA